MATKQSQLKKLQELLQSSELRKEVRAARDQSAVIKRVMAAGVKEGFKFSERWLKESFDDVKLVRKPAALTERELLALAGRGGLAAAGSENKLCHTESCGGRHGGCC